MVDYYGVLKEVVELEYPGLPIKRAYLFHCDWYDPRQNIGMRMDPKYKMVDINHKQFLKKFEPFALAHQATQVYYIPYPSQRRASADWLHVCHVVPRRTIDMATLDNALQVDEVQASEIDNLDDELDSLQDPSGTFDDVDQLVDNVNEVEYSSSSDEEELEEELENTTDADDFSE